MELVPFSFQPEAIGTRYVPFFVPFLTNTKSSTCSSLFYQKNLIFVLCGSFKTQKNWRKRGLLGQHLHFICKSFQLWRILSGGTTLLCNDFFLLKIINLKKNYGKSSHHIIHHPAHKKLWKASHWPKNFQVKHFIIFCWIILGRRRVHLPELQQIHILHLCIQ